MERWVLRLGYQLIEDICLEIKMPLWMQVEAELLNSEMVHRYSFKAL